MPITPERVQKLRDFGLSEYGARAYLALLDLGLTEARDVSNLSKVPQAKIYQILEQLHEKGLVTILPEFPKKYAPVPFASFVDRMLEEQLQITRALERDRGQLAELFSVMGDVDVGDRGDFSIVRGRRNVVEVLLKLIASTKSDFFLMGTEGMAGWADFLREPLAGAAKRGVHLRLLMPHTKDTGAKLAPLAELGEMRARDLEEISQSTRVAIVLVDGARAFLINFVPDDGDLYAGKDMAVSTDQEAMVSAIQTLVEPLWQPATAYATRRHELESGQEAAFTRLISTPEAIARALDDAVARDVGSIRVIEQADLVTRSGWSSTLVSATLARGGDVQLLVRVPPHEASPPVEVPTGSGCAVRYLDHHVVSRTWILGEREAFFSVGGSPVDASSSEMLVHTTEPALLQSICRHYEQAWESALDRVPRRAPSVPLRVETLCSLLDACEEAALLVAADGCVVAGNQQAQLLLGASFVDADVRLDAIVEGAQVHAEAGRIVTLDGDRGHMRRPNGRVAPVHVSMRTLGPAAGHALVTIRPALRTTTSQPKFA